MLTHPTAHELVDGVARWLAADPTPSGFQLRVARNALEIAARDMAQGPDADRRAVERLSALLGIEGDRDLLDAALTTALREGRIAPDAPALLAHLRASALDSLAIDQPRYAHEL
jgi:hypothetical protein